MQLYHFKGTIKATKRDLGGETDIYVIASDQDDATSQTNFAENVTLIKSEKLNSNWK